MKATDRKLKAMLLMIAARRFLATNTNSAAPYASSAMVAHEQTHVMALIQQPPRDRRADQRGPTDDKDPLDPHGIPSRGPNRRSM